jgi:phosphate transport system substrate-binding protein
MVRRFGFLFIAFLSCFLFFQHAFAEEMIHGAGATFPYPIYSKWFDAFGKARPDAFPINYQSIGSGGGIRQASDGIIDFGATDGPMTDEQIQKAKVKLLHFPTVLGAVALCYNLPDVKASIRINPQTLAGIFLGTVNKWNDGQIVKTNQGVALPNRPIVVVHRSDGSGTTFVMVDYLSKVNPLWKEKVGVGTSVSWPVGLGGKGNEGVTGMVRQLPYSIGYVEVIYAEQNNIPVMAIQNRAGQFVLPNVKSISAAALGQTLPPDFRVSITDPSGKEAYPISSFTWLLIPEKVANPAKGKVIVDFLKWMVKEGQAIAPALSYAPLPKEVALTVESAIGRIQY